MPVRSVPDKLCPNNLLHFPLGLAFCRAICPGFERDFAAKVKALLESNAANAVALSYVDNWEPSQHWPVAPVFKDALTGIAARLERNPRLDVKTSQHYIVVKLKNGLSGLGDTYVQPFDSPLVMPNDQPLMITGQTKLDKFFRGRGWSTLEDFGIWSTSKSSTVLIHPSEEAGRNPLEMTLTFAPYTPGPIDKMTVNILVNGELLATKKYVGPAAAATEQVTVARDLLNSDGNATIEFKAEPLRSPADLGGLDTRKLGVKLLSISMD